MGGDGAEALHVTGGLGRQSLPNLKISLNLSSPECTTMVKYKIDLTRKLKMATKKIQKSVSEHCASFETKFYLFFIQMVKTYLKN